MSMLFNQNAEYVPIRERRESSTPVGGLASLNSELLHEVNGCQSVRMTLVGPVSAPNLTATFEGTSNGVHWVPMPAYIQGSSVTNISTVQPYPFFTINVANFRGNLSANCSGFKKVRVRVSAYTSGAVDVSLVSEDTNAVSFQESSSFASHAVTATAAVGVAAVATVTGIFSLRSYIKSIRITRFATALLTAGTTPVLVTTTNTPGTLVFSLPAENAAQGSSTDFVYDFGDGLVSTLAGTNTVVTCPATPNVIWRVTVVYRLGL